MWVCSFHIGFSVQLKKAIFARACNFPLLATGRNIRVVQNIYSKKIYQKLTPKIELKVFSSLKCDNLKYLKIKLKERKFKTHSNIPEIGKMTLILKHPKPGQQQFIEQTLNPSCVANF